jgi:hypothetical protein
VVTLDEPPGGLLSVLGQGYAQVVQVYVTTHGQHFHQDPSCRWLSSTFTTAPAHAVPVSSVDGLAPCRTCYPDAPRAKFTKLRCKQCRSVRPCAHNGGVLVLVPVRWRKGTHLLPAGSVTLRRAYVWPDVAYLYDRVEKTEQV